MTAKEKAKELISKFTFLTYPESDAKFYNPKQCALISVDEVIDNLVDLSNGEFIFIYQVDYWKEVKKEIETI